MVDIPSQKRAKQRAADYLLDRKFMHRAGRRSLDTGEFLRGHQMTDKQWTTLQMEIESERRQLMAMPAEQVIDLCRQERGKEKNEEKQQTVKHQEALNNFEYWSNRPHWIVEEAYALAVGTSELNEPWVDPVLYRQWFDNVRDLMRRALESGELPVICTTLVKAPTGEHPCDCISPHDFIAWAAKKQIHLPQALADAVARYHVPGDNKAENTAVTHPYITAVEAIIWIAYKKWLTYAKLFDHCGQEDIFYRSQFSSMGSRDRGTDHNSYPYDIGKDEMLIFASYLAEQKMWTEETWRKARRGAIQDVETMQKCLDTERNKHGFTLPEFVERLKNSIAYDNEQSQKLHNATQKLLNAARDKKLAIRGKRKNGNGDIEDIPLGFLDRLDYIIDLWGNKISPSPQARWNAETLQQVKQIEVMGWHELRVKREDVLRLWPEHPVSVSPPNLSAENQNNSLPRLEHYWKTDFPNTLKLFQNITVANKIPNNIPKETVIKFHIYQDHAANTKFIGFYIPATSDTYQLCIYLAETYKEFMDEFNGSVHIEFKGAGDFSSIPSHELTFTGRVYIYHETELSHEQLGNLVALYREKKLHVQFRGDSYSTTRWLQDKANSKDIPKQTPELPVPDYFNELKYAPEIAAARELKARKDKAFDTLPAPDWREWGNIPMVPLWKVVALSLNVDPAALEVHGVFDPEFHGGLSEEFKLRLRVTIANQPALGIYTGAMRGYFHPTSYYIPVEVARFFKWAVGIIGWELPASFPNGISNNDSGIVTAPAPTVETAVSKPNENNRNSRGPKPVKTTEIKNKILDALKSGEMTVESLLSEKQENLASQYGASREIVVKARDSAISEYQPGKEIVGID